MVKSYNGDAVVVNVSLVVKLLLWEVLENRRNCKAGVAVGEDEHTELSVLLMGTARRRVSQNHQHHGSPWLRSDGKGRLT